MSNDVHSVSDFVAGVPSTITIDAELATKADVIPTHIIVNSLADFPAPVANVITLADNTAYLIVGTVDISPNRIVTGIRNTIGGEDKQNDILLSDTSGVLLTMDSSSTDLKALTLNTCTVRAVNGTLFSITSTAQRNVFVIDNCNLTSSSTIGTLNNFTSFVMRNSAFTNATVGGVTITGTNGTFRVRDGNYATVTGTCFAFGVSTCTSIGISRNLITTTGGQTFLSGTTGGANVSVAGLLHDNIFNGGGTYVSTITATDTNWLWTANVGVTNTPIGSSPVWGDITGTLTDQLDLQAELDLKADVGDAPTAHADSHKLGGSDVILLNEFGNPTASVEFNQQQALQFRLENRTSDPGSPANGECWLRTDL